MLVAYNQPWWQYLHHGTQQVPQIGYFLQESQLTGTPLLMLVSKCQRDVWNPEKAFRAAVLFLNFRVNHWKKKLMRIWISENLYFHIPNSPSSYSPSFPLGWMQTVGGTKLRKTWVTVISLALSTWLLLFLFFPWVFPRLCPALVQRLPTENSFFCREYTLRAWGILGKSSSSTWRSFAKQIGFSWKGTTLVGEYNFLLSFHTKL